MKTNTAAVLEALLFTSGEPLSFSRLAKIIGGTAAETRKAIDDLGSRYAHDAGSGLQLIVKDNQVVLATKNEIAPIVQEFIKSTMQENLSKAALEVLAIIAYRAPITRSEIEAIRGVNCHFTLRNLLLRDLIERAGNPEDGRGYVYRPSFKLLEHLGLGAPSELPDYAVLSQDERLKNVAHETSRDGLLP